MSNQELRLKYILDLASNIGVKARQEALVVEESNRRMDNAIARTDKKYGLLDRSMQALANNTSLQRQVGYMDRLAAGIDKVHQRAQQLKTTLATGMQHLPELATAGAAGYYGGKAVLAPPVRAYSDLESATVDLRVAMLDAKGNVNKAFAGIAKEAESLGNKLPGTSADFLGAAAALIKQGVSPDAVKNGGLRASSYFGVLMGMNQAQAAETIAKVREASGLKDNELVPMADLMQRGSYGFGIKPSDYLEVARYAAPTYNTMGTTGLENAKKMLALQGMAASVGLEASSFGTNISQMMNRLSQVDGRANRNSPDARAMKKLLQEQGIQMSFYDEKGQFSGPENMLEQLAKLRKLSPLQQQRTIHQLFGDEGGRPAQIMVQKGIEQYRANLATLDSQASIDQRITAKMDSFASKLDALGGTITNVMAKLASQMGEGSKSWIDKANDLAGGAGGFFDEHPTFGSVMLGGAAVGGAALAGRGGLALLSRFSGRGASALASGTGSATSAAAMQAAARAARAPLGSASARTSAFRTAVAEARMASKSAGAWAPIERSAAMASRMGMVARVLPWLGLGIESYDVMTDEQLTAAGKARGLGMAAGGAAGAWAGASTGAAWGTVVAPGVGTFLGGLAGGALGYMGGKSAIGAMWGSDPQRDFVRLTDPKGVSMGSVGAGGQTTVQLGEGRLQVDVRLSNDGSYGVSTSVLSPLPLIRVDAGATNPGSFSSMSGG